MILSLINRRSYGGYMDQVISNLKAKEIIYKKSIEVLKKYIIDKYPEASEAYRAQVFADAVHKIIDDHIREFRRSDQLVIKAKLLRTTATKENFEIFAYDIMKTCVSLDIDEESFIDNMTSWINRQQEIPVYRNQLIEMTDVVKEEIADEARAEAAKENRASAAAESELLVQLEKAFEFRPIYENQEDAPELYTEGVVNSAYEAEIRKDIQEEARKLTEELVEVEEEIVEVNKAKELPKIFEEASIEEILEDKEIMPFKEKSSSTQETFFDRLGGMDQLYSEDEMAEPAEAYEETVSLEDEESGGVIAQEERPIIKVTMDPEPYFPQWPEAQNIEEHQSGFMAEIRGALAGQDLTKLVSIGLLSLAGFIAVIWLLVQLISGNFSNAEETVEQLEKASPIIETSTEILVEGSETEMISGGDMAMVSLEIDSTHLHESIQYKTIDALALQAFFLRNDNLIGEEPYFSTIIEVAETYGVNPLLLFAITGQEQHFVPKNHEFAEQMINNPFNVYGSWERYNTNIKESTQIAARTILTASEGRIQGTDPVEWINNTYAEDPNWSTGVNLILEHLEAIAGR